MRVSLVARFVSHPIVHFGTGRSARGLPRLGLAGAATTYHRPRTGSVAATLRVLRGQTSTFRFPAVGRARRLPARRLALPHGLPRGRRA